MGAKMSNAGIVCLSLSISIGVFGQLFLKLSVSENYPTIPIIGTWNYFFILAGFLYFISLLLYSYSLKTIPLHIAFPSVSISYVAVSYGSHLIWGTNFGAKELIALILIAAGIVLMFSGVDP